MSLDGFITGPDDSMDFAFRSGLGQSEVAEEVMRATGAILAGRRWHDVAERKYGGSKGIYGGRWTGPVFVLTHRPQDPSTDPSITFLSDGLERAVGIARDAAVGRNLEIFGASIAQQCLQAGLVDEIVVHLVPVLLGDGVRFYGGPAVREIGLERITLGEAGQLTDMRFRIVR
jgi:dihydrofolate reductase